jgi:membrane protein YdbS with pleckstrin-like domain
MYPGPGAGNRPPDEPGGHRPEHDTDPLPFLGRVQARVQGEGPARRPGRSRFRRKGRDRGPDPFAVPSDRDVAQVGDPIPSPLVDRYLFSTERFCGEWRRHWTFLWKEIVVAIVATFLLGFATGMTGPNAGTLAGVATTGWILVLVWVLFRVGDWYFDHFVLTSRRVMVVSGLISRKVAMMPLARVTDMAYNQSPMGRALGYGTFVLESAGQDQALREVDHLPHPRELYLLMLDEMYGPDPKPRPERRRRDSSGGD